MINQISYQTALDNMINNIRDLVIDSGLCGKSWYIHVNKIKNR